MLWCFDLLGYRGEDIRANPCALAATARAHGRPWHRACVGTLPTLSAGLWCTRTVAAKACVGRLSERAQLGGKWKKPAAQNS